MAKKGGASGVGGAEGSSDEQGGLTSIDDFSSSVSMRLSGVRGLGALLQRYEEASLDVAAFVEQLKRLLGAKLGTQVSAWEPLAHEPELRVGVVGFAFGVGGAGGGVSTSCSTLCLILPTTRCLQGGVVTHSSSRFPWWVALQLASSNKLTRERLSGLQVQVAALVLGEWAWASAERSGGAASEKAREHRSMLS